MTHKNFHVWTECWMERPDLTEGFGGWQVVDGTPQVLSDGKYQVGPYPVKAIQQDKTDLKYDGKYVTAEVKADYKYHKKDSKEPSGWKLLAVQKDMAGRLILTEKLDLHGETHEAEDITHTYKNKKSLARGRTMSVVELTFNHSKTVTAGDTIHVVYTVINNDLDARDVSVNVDASAVTYNNLDPAMLASTSRKFNVPAGADESFELNIDAEAYVGKLHFEGIVLFNAVASFEGGIFNTRDTVTVQMPPLKLEASGGPGEPELTDAEERVIGLLSEASLVGIEGAFDIGARQLERHERTQVAADRDSEISPDFFVIDPGAGSSTAPQRSWSVHSSPSTSDGMLCNQSGGAVAEAVTSQFPQ
ncbi:hemocyte protein-glutamine gamma-glutamyltransferase-like [Ixodes scapularis]|uniref:hemocyte protein-glutamine gamma-glutamyltransferase-like n=1 Tax=Ixodes scapularis TaxID=6945 RepID=UPI001C389B45|nr:hemocyte protein-glutamine gamma-glutamyltransferase-like [Ixodes scapularis]